MWGSNSWSRDDLTIQQSLAQDPVPVTETVTHIAQQHAIDRDIALRRPYTFDRVTY
jgi:hypothetical protein